MVAVTTGPILEQPSDPNEFLWRYMGVPKFLDLIRTSCLYFNRADNFEDNFEGTLSLANLEKRTSEYKVGYDEKVFRQLDEFFAIMRKMTYVSCWHLSREESHAMWKIYGASNEAVAIRVKYADLVDELPNNYYVGCVNYIDYRKDWMPEGVTYAPIIHKRKYFEYEREVRAFMQYSIEGDVLSRASINDKLGVCAKVDLKKIINQVRVSPLSSDWFFQSIKDVVEKYGYSFDVSRSSLDESPYLP